MPRVSVLVPARNEEAHIGDCVRSLLAQDYPDFEVIVLDDHSTDRTGAILADLSARDERLRVLRGRDLPDGWLGKHWACQQLSEAAGGELFLFTDADTRHSPGSVRHGVEALYAEGADLLTAFPHEETVTWAEKLVVPVVPWAIFTFLPLALAYRTASPAFSATIGQYMLFRASAYARIGGHAAVCGDPVDDIALGRRIKAQGLRWRLADATRDVSCRMYQNAGQVFEGFSKNLFAGFGFRLLPFILVWLWLAIVFLLPLGVLLLRLAGAPVPALDVGIALIGVAAGLASWGLTYLRFGIPAYLIPLYPATLLLAVTIAVRSVLLAAQGGSTWKGRRLLRHRVRWW
jgi:chlorobactene glucosyltransferase